MAQTWFQIMLIVCLLEEQIPELLLTCFTIQPRVAIATFAEQFMISVTAR